MVEYNENNDETPRKRKGLFGSRRVRSADMVPAEQSAAPVPDAVEPREQPAAEQPVAEQPAAEQPAAEQPVAEQPALEQAVAQRASRSRRASSASAAAAPTENPTEEAAPAEPVTARRTRQSAAKSTATRSTAASRATKAKAETPAPDEAPAADGTPAADDTAEQSTEQSAEQPTTPEAPAAPARPSTSLLFQAPELPAYAPRQQSRDNRGGNDRDNRGESRDDGRDEDEQTTVRRRSRRRSGEEDRDTGSSNPRNTVVKVRTPRPQPEPITEPQRIKGSTRLEAKKQRRRDGRDAGRRRPVITEAEFLARRESVDRVMVVRAKFGRIQIGVLEDGVLSEHYVAKAQEASLIGNVYLGRVQNVLPSMEAAFVDIGRGRNAVLYSGEVDWDAAALENSSGGSQARRIELALKPGDKVLVQVTKDPIGHKGARLTSQVSLPGRYLVYVPNGSMNGISRKLPDTERARLKKILKEVLPENVGVIVRTAAEGATDEQLTLDVNRLTSQWARISETIEKAQAPALLHSEPDLLVKIVRDVFNEDFQKLIIEGQDAEETISSYLAQVAPDLVDRIERYESETDSFDAHRISEQIEKALDRKVWLPSGGSLVIDRTEAMTVVDVNTGKFVGSGGNLEETVTMNNLEAAEELVRQLRLRDIGGIIVVDFIDMVLESNRDLVLRRLVECLSRDRTKHQVAEVTSLGLVQMTRKKLGLGLIESFSENCEVCAGRGIVIHHDPATKHRQSPQPETGRRGRKGGNGGGPTPPAPKSGTGTHAITEDARNALAKIATSTILTQVEAHAKAETAPAEQSVSQLAALAVEQPAEEPAEQPAEQQATVEVVAPVRVEAPAETAAETPAETPVAIFDLPLKRQTRAPRKISTHDAEQILDSVLDALPEPRQAGQGRVRTSRRASSAGTVSAPADGSQN
ncbi:Rne/Rng family ribonuclease [Marisediminicola antarctica]|uniref:Ribonuclease E n=1 Tax=Marisediminicola antarctica TaxID=674079 RepID=A0A7L5AHH6_9MICO|nr:Rne/Rng family ribonuclease [Marisediminicola antarctica]QHO69757.1 ribonuclease G [Marisediminicola antarctica]